MKIQIDGEVREATADEVARIEADRQAQEAREAQTAALKASIAAKFAALGLSETEVKALVG